MYFNFYKNWALISAIRALLVIQVAITSEILLNISLKITVNQISTNTRAGLESETLLLGICYSESSTNYDSCSYGSVAIFDKRCKKGFDNCEISPNIIRCAWDPSWIDSMNLAMNNIAEPPPPP